MKNTQKGSVEVAVGIIVVMFIAGIIFFGMWGLPKYRIYKQDLAGQANLRQQEWEKKILIEGARAKKDSAQLEADAEITRATGVAEANRIIGDSLKNNESYLRYLWINNIQQGNGTERIYIPTEAGMPILEARYK